jgi:hypothetical protein
MCEKKSVFKMMPPHKMNDLSQDQFGNIPTLKSGVLDSQGYTIRGQAISAIESGNYGS